MAVVELLTLYAQRHTDGRVTLQRSPEDGAPVVATYPVWSSLRPSHRNRYVTHNCFRYRLKWLDRKAPT